MIYKFTNSEDIPEDLDTRKQYTTKVVECYFKDGELTIELEYIGEEYNPESPQCLLPISRKED